MKYDDAAFRRMRGEIATLASLTLKVGVVGPGASEFEEGSTMTLAELMLIHEYGTKTIPARAPIVDDAGAPSSPSCRCGCASASSPVRFTRARPRS